MSTSACIPDTRFCMSVIKSFEATCWWRSSPQLRTNWSARFNDNSWTLGFFRRSLFRNSRQASLAPSFPFEFTASQTFMFKARSEPKSVSLVAASTIRPISVLISKTCWKDFVKSLMIDISEIQTNHSMPSRLSRRRPGEREAERAWLLLRQFRWGGMRPIMRAEEPHPRGGRGRAGCSLVMRVSLWNVFYLAARGPGPGATKLLEPTPQVRRPLCNEDASKSRWFILFRFGVPSLVTEVPW